MKPPDIMEVVWEDWYDHWLIEDQPPSQHGLHDKSSAEAKSTRVGA